MIGPRLDEKDARSLVRQVTLHLRKLGAHVTEVGVSLNPEGFTFRAIVNGHDVWVRTGQGNFRYEAIAVELLNEALFHHVEFSHPELRIVAN